LAMAVVRSSRSFMVLAREESSAASGCTPPF
jgi:hypothetical protein